MAKIKLKKSLQVVLEHSKQTIIKAISDAMMQQVQPKSEISWLLLEYTLEYPFPPTIALAQRSEMDLYVDPEEHPLLCYNVADVELFSENGNIMIDFHSFDDLFDTADELLEEIEYENREPFIFQLYVDVCKALMIESVNWTHLSLVENFHVTARDYEICNEELFLKKLLPKKTLNKMKRKITAYNTKVNDAYTNDETVVKVREVVEVESIRYEDLLASLTLDVCTDVFVTEEIYFMKPFYVELTMHKRAHEMEYELSTQKPENESCYYQYKFSNNIPQLLDYFYDGKLIWRKIFQYRDGVKTCHKFFLKSSSPEFEDYAILTSGVDAADVYCKYSDSHFDEITYAKNAEGQTISAVHFRSIFQMGYKMDSIFNYVFEYRNDNLFKITCVNEYGNKTVSYCQDDSFMEEAIDAFIDHLCAYTIAKMKTFSLENLEAIVLVYDSSLSFYFNVNLLRDKVLFDISSYEQYENDSAMMNLSVYTSESETSPEKEYLSRDKAEAFVAEVYLRLCSTLSERIYNNFQISVPVVTKFIHDELDL